MSAQTRKVGLVAMLQGPRHAGAGRTDRSNIACPAGCLRTGAGEEKNSE